MRMQKTICVAKSYKHMYENCAGRLLDALVIVQYMHLLYITCGVVVYNCFSVNGLHLTAGEMTGKSITETISINRRTGGNSN